MAREVIRISQSRYPWYPPIPYPPAEETARDFLTNFELQLQDEGYDLC